ncbi:MAG: precorrin-6A synthase (deacetylating) [Roseovarius sp.]
MIDLWLIGIGTGNPGHVTLEARDALRQASLVLVPRKGPDKADLVDLRHTILRACDSPARVVEFDMPVRDENLPYGARVARWHDEIARIWTKTIAAARPDGPVAMLVWGDPGLYDSTLRIAARLDPVPRLRVLPGITALQALTAAHPIPFNTVNGAVTVTTGRRLTAHGWPGASDTVVVMLDGACAFQHLDPDGVHIWWGAYLGMPEQVLDAGPLAEAGPRIIEKRAAARTRHGWIMDTYLMRRITSPDSGGEGGKPFAAGRGVSPNYSVRPDGAFHLWRKDPPR